ncbi:SDR family NAD(P)-dependent oxidoreductase [Pseudoalteromonas sp. JBTF-M23]|uniref:SDR family NAD(P)-dependent oxidoreductase n=1 Tax=Pseudoalteromonas caenipelagi TaxID=2726988 RepID=A0A849VDY3_9GAMM|nr:SDR family NAD(P)-dependent oxidoreductase [Pseudoalteromonas caenipelagi]NOU49937.1 SDR family NAD(P)-dependent oxidoreductase [Pseudoalteromonas caenipelagi]
MQLVKKNIVITGGTSGIGYQMVKLLHSSNQVIVIARQSDRLDKLKDEFPSIDVYPCDLSNPRCYEEAADKLVKDYESIDLLINNAAVQSSPTYLDDDFNYDAISPEINVNLTAVCSLSYLLLPSLLNNQQQAIIANINSGLALAPKTNSAVYCATKAAMNVFSQSLNYQLEETNVRVIQAFLPLVDTPMTAERGKGKLTAKKAATDILDGISNASTINNIGKVKLLRLLLLVAPFIAKKIMKGL